MVYALEHLGHTVRVICPGAARRDPGLQPSHAKKVHTGSIRSKALTQVLELAYNTVTYARAWRGIRAMRPAFVYERYTPLNFGGVLAAKHLGTPIILEVNATYAGKLGCDIQVAYPKTLARIEKSVLNWADGIIVVSEPLRDCVVERIIDPSKVLVTPNAINLNRLENLDVRSTRDRIRKKYHIRQGFVVGFVGSMRRWHGLDFLAESMADVLSRWSDTHFLLVGTGEMESELRAYVSEHGLSEHVTITGAVPHEEVYPILSAIDVGVSPDTPPYASPMKLLEYMALGAVPVAPDYPPIREIISDGRTGLIFPPRSKLDFVECIVGLAENRSLLQSLGNAAKEEVLKERTWTKNAQSIIDLSMKIVKH